MKRSLNLSVSKPAAQSHKPSPKQPRLDKPCAQQQQLIQQALEQLGFSSLRPGQEQAVQAVLQGRDSFILMPTGGGKSLCFTLPALLSNGLVVIVSPLIALMQDQVSALRAKQVPCAYLSSTLSEKEREDIKGRQMGVSCSSGTTGPNYAALPRSQHTLRMLYVTPESLSNEDFKSRLQALYRGGFLTLFAIDEAHCISSWGHNFRPSYRWLGNLRRYMPQVPIMALTATARPEVQVDIIKQLRLHSESLQRVVSSFDRPNIKYSVLLADVLPSAPPPANTPGQLQPDDCDDALGLPGGGGAGAAQGGSGLVLGGFNKKQMEALCSLVREHVGDAGERGCAIIYVRKKGDVEKIASCLTKLLAGSRLRIGHYHAGIAGKLRTQVNSDWKAERLDVVVATVAFGMGLDRPNVRLVVHWNLPGSLEGYYQESGRAGRDGLPAHSVMFYASQDKQSMEWLVQKAAREAEAKKASDGAGGKGGFGLSVNSTAQASEEPDSGLAARSFAKVVEYAKQASCRRATLLAHFSETMRPGGCRNCDACCNNEAVRSSLAALSMAEAKQAFQRASNRTFMGSSNNGGPQELEDEREGEEEEGGARESEEEDYGQGGVVLDDVPRSAVERQQDHDQKGVQAAARSAARAKQQLQSSKPGSMMDYLEAMEAAESRNAGFQNKAGGLRLEPGQARQHSSSAAPAQAGISAELRNSSVERLAQRLRSAPCAAGLDHTALRLVAVSVEGVVHRDSGGHRQAYSGALSRAAAKFTSAPSVFSLPLQLLRDLQACTPPSSTHTSPPPTQGTPSAPSAPNTSAAGASKPSSNSGSANTASAGGLGEGQARMLSTLLQCELSACKRHAEGLAGEGGGGGGGVGGVSHHQQQPQQQQQQQQGQQQHVQQQDQSQAGLGVSAATAAAASALQARIQALHALWVPLEVLKMGAGRSAGDLRKACACVGGSFPQVTQAARDLVEIWRKQLQPASQQQ